MAFSSLRMTKSGPTIQTYFAKVLPKIPLKSAQAVLEMSQEGATVPFMARYRKEKTGNLDEVEIKAVIDAHELFTEVQNRQQFLIKEIEKQGQLTQDLRDRILASLDLGELEEIYRPFKKKKKTKATLAREAGLESLADWLWQIGHGELADTTDIAVKAKEFLNAAAQVVTYEHALKGAQDILVERVHNNPELRASLRKELLEQGKVVSKKTKTYKAHSKFEMYAEFSEKVSSLRVPKNSHRYLAMRRGWHEGELTLTIESDLALVEKQFESYACTHEGTVATDYLKTCAKAALHQHVIPSISNEIHSLLKEESDKHAVGVFSENVRKILLASPFGAKWVLGVDPGLRTGCKLALVDNASKYITSTILNILDSDVEKTAEGLLKELVGKIDAVAVGNGTAGREAYNLLRKVVQSLGATTPVILVNESGASVYSASEVAREEFPELDVTVRGAISIARRLQDPLAELVKIDPKSIGVGQYQHDVSQTLLKKNLDFVVESCVNKVGVDLNTASEFLLRYISGIGPALAKNIVSYRNEHGQFKSRDELTKVSQFGSKAFEQAAGFLRIPGAQNPLDRTGIHPERYSVVRDMASELGATISSLTGENAKKILDLRTKWIDLVGEFTFDDIVKELESPGRDPRDPFKTFSYRDDIAKLEDLKENMICPGIVTNVTNFGAFVDIGVHQDGLVHISALADQFVDDPQKIVAPGDVVTVRVIGVNIEKKQISLSMKLQDKPQGQRAQNRHSEDSRPPRERPPRGDRSSERPAGREARGSRGGRGAGERPPKSGDRSRGGGRDRQGPRDQKPRKPAQPLNNAFASLAALRDQLRKN
jgi:uncharacterized protein